MGLMNNVKKLASKQNIDKAKGMAAKNADKITGTVGKATDAIDKRTGGKYRDKLDKVEGTVARNLEQAKRDGEDPQDPRPDTDPRR
jgi:hypothetical protein